MPLNARSPLVAPRELFPHIGESDLVVADVRWINGQPSAARDAFLAGRLPGAVFLDLDDDLADRSDLTRGRHPLPDPKRLVAALAAAGIGRKSRVVVYDDVAGSNAARLWWLLRWLGHKRVWLLDGGINLWTAEGFPLEQGPARIPLPASRPLEPTANASMIVDRTYIEAAIASGILVLDARAPERYRGEVEPIDSRAGHIPGALNAPWAQNLTDEPTPRFLAPGELRQKFAALGVAQDSEIICYCGSGVTACHNILALHLAGMGKVRLYPGSWSEWIHHHK